MNSRPLKKEWVEERQSNWFNSNDTNWDNLHGWTARRVGQAINACIDEQTAVSYLKNRIADRKGKTSYSQACREIETTARNLYRKDIGPSDQSEGRPRPLPRAEVYITPEQKAANLTSLITTRGVSQNDICSLSPYPIPPGVHHHSRLFFQTMFKPDDLLFAAHTERVKREHQARYIRPAAQWAGDSPGVGEWDKIDRVPQVLCISPLTGQPDEEGSYRAGECRASVPYMLVEIDDAPLQAQRDLWLSLILDSIPIVALVYSGNKSYHAWILVRGETIDERDRYIYDRYAELFDMLGVDRNKKGKATLARVPGSYRLDKETGEVEKDEHGINRAARLVYLNSCFSCVVRS